SRLLKLVNDFFRKGKNIITLNNGVDPDGKELLMDTYRMHLVLNDKDQFKKVLENLKIQFIKEIRVKRQRFLKDITEKKTASYLKFYFTILKAISIRQNTLGQK
ncbi:hypothetical protein B6D29_01605, partial [Microgenomates bacterium UTCPR1]